MYYSQLQLLKNIQYVANIFKSQANGKKTKSSQTLNDVMKGKQC